MKARLSSLLIGALVVLLAPTTSAQRAANYASHGTVSSGSYRGAYASSRVWVPGHYESVSRRVYVPGPTRSVWVEPDYEWQVGPCGVRYVCVRAGHWKTVQLPGHYENRRVRVWREGTWVARGACN